MTLIKNKGLFSKQILIGRKMTNHRMDELFLKTKKECIWLLEHIFQFPDPRMSFQRKANQRNQNGLEQKRSQFRAQKRTSANVVHVLSALF